MLNFHELSFRRLDILFASLKSQELVHLLLELRKNILIVSQLLESGIVRIEHPLYIVIAVFSSSLSEHLGVVIEEIWVDHIQEPRLALELTLEQHHARGCYPIHKNTRWPRVGERQVEEHEYREERPESIDVPVLVFLRYSPLNFKRWLDF